VQAQGQFGVSAWLGWGGVVDRAPRYRTMVWAGRVRDGPPAAGLRPSSSPFCAAGPTSPPQIVSGNHFSQFFFASEKLLRFLSLFFCTNMRGQFAVAEIQMMNGLTTFQA